MSESAIKAGEFARLMETIGLRAEDGPVAVAVSGGTDSMALCLLAHDWGKVHALTVDHGLRAESANEARQVNAWLKHRGIEHEILRWHGDKPQAGVQAAARKARYTLLQDKCRALNIDRLLLAHHMDDQAETFLLRLARGSGLWGLSAMAPSAPPLGQGYECLPRRYRPFLSVPKSRLIATCHAYGQQWIEDPSNEAMQYDRTLARQMLADPPLPGLTAQRLSETAQRLSQAHAALEHYLRLLWTQCVDLSPFGYATLSLNAMRDAPKELKLRLISRLIQQIAGRIHPPRFARIEAASSVMDESGFRGATVAGCQLVPCDDDHVMICREPAACSDIAPLEKGRWVLWDGRYHFLLEDGFDGTAIKGLGEDGWRRLCHEQPEIRAIAPPYPVVLSLPALWRGTDLIAVPHLSYETESTRLIMKAVVPDWVKRGIWEEDSHEKGGL